MTMKSHGDGWKMENCCVVGEQSLLKFRISPSFASSCHSHGKTQQWKWIFTSKTTHTVSIEHWRLSFVDNFYIKKYIFTCRKRSRKNVCVLIMKWKIYIIFVSFTFTPTRVAAQTENCLSTCKLNYMAKTLTFIFPRNFFIINKRASLFCRRQSSALLSLKFRAIFFTAEKPFAIRRMRRTETKETEMFTVTRCLQLIFIFRVFYSSQRNFVVVLRCFWWNGEKSFSMRRECAVK